MAQLGGARHLHRHHGDRLLADRKLGTEGAHAPGEYGSLGYGRMSIVN